jgi:histidyl-tRNA synthetase
MKDAPSPVIEPRTLKGFRDFLPHSMIERERVIDIARRVYRSYGFAPIDTPALEYLDILLGKGSDETDRQLYRFQDHGGRDVGMRFDLTVPLARFVAQHIGELGIPFKRYQIAKVWRGENTQHGRYREFVQCDFDTIGTESAMADSEMVLVIHDLMSALGLSRYTIRINHRSLLTAALELSGLEEHSALILRALDKLSKIGPEKVSMEMQSMAGASESQARQVLELANINGSPTEIIKESEKLVGASTLGQRGIATLAQVLEDLNSANVPAERFAIDLSIARGLDYYSGTVVETILSDLPQIGSVCSGGRYDDLASVYSKQRLPGVGASLGLDRLIAALETLGLARPTPSVAKVLVAYFASDRRQVYIRLASRLRRHGIPTVLYPEPRKLGQQLKFADSQGIPVVIIAGDQELDRGVCQVKILAQRDAEEISLDSGVFEQDVARIVDRTV